MTNNYHTDRPLSADLFLSSAARLTDYHLLYGYLGLALGYGLTAVLIIIFTRGRLGYQHYRPQSGY